jgi:hypothetical protein
MRHKQTRPKRKYVLANVKNEAAGSDDDRADQHQEGQQQQLPSLSGRPVEPVPKYHYAVANDINISTKAQHESVGALAELIVATKANGRPPAGAAPEAITVQLFQKQRAGWQPRPKHVLLFSWQCPDEEDIGPRHEVRSSMLWPGARA